MGRTTAMLSLLGDQEERGRDASRGVAAHVALPVGTSFFITMLDSLVFPFPFFCNFLAVCRYHSSSVQCDCS